MRQFKHGGGWNAAKRDGAIFEAWADGEIPVLKAIRDISKYNDWKGVQHDEFVEIANSLGYFRTGRKKGNNDLFE